MKILYYCQHVLGVGHVHRSLEICRACSAAHQVKMIIGGPDIDLGSEPFSLLRLPGLQMDDQFSRLISCDPGVDLDQVKEMRQEQLLAFFHEFTPDCLVLELYPFGRKAFRFELTPLLEAARQTPCTVACSLRDILVEKKVDRLMHEERAVKTLNKYFDALFVHADPKIVPIEATFGLADQIEVPLYYTGFITPQPRKDARSVLRCSINLNDEDKLIVASIGSGSVGSHLLEAVAAAAQIMNCQEHVHLNIFTGPYCDVAAYRRLAEAQRPNLAVERFSDRFIDWLAAADLSVSMAGYNTSMNIMAAGVPALMLPFEQNFEQRLRVEKLTAEHPIRMLEENDLTAKRLARIMTSQLQEARYKTAIDLDGARQTCRIIETL